MARRSLDILPPDPSDFSPDQWDAVTSTARHLFLSAPIRTGKTRDTSEAFDQRVKRDFTNQFVNELARSEPIRYWVGAPTYKLNVPQKIYLVPMLKRLGLIDFKAQGGMTVGTNVTKGGGAIHLVNNRIIEFVSLDTPDSLVGATVRGGWISEIARCDEKSVDEFFGRMTNFDDSWLVADTSPYGKGWFYRRFIEPLRNGTYPNGQLVEWSYESILQWIESKWFKGRPFLHRAEFELKRQQLPTWMFRRDYLAIWESAVGQVYANWGAENIVKRDPVKSIREGWRLHIAADLNATPEKPACWLLVAFHPATEAIHVVREYEKYVGIEFKGYADSLWECAREHRVDSVIVDPSIRVEIKERLRARGISVRNGNPSVDAGIRRVAEMIGGRLLTSEPDNVNLFNEFAEYRWKVDRQGEAMGEPDKKAFDPHRLDALRYAVMTLTGQKTRAGKAA
jgi:hypothetical protein